MEVNASELLPSFLISQMIEKFSKKKQTLTFLDRTQCEKELSWPKWVNIEKLKLIRNNGVDI